MHGFKLACDSQVHWRQTQQRASSQLQETSLCFIKKIGQIEEGKNSYTISFPLIEKPKKEDKEVELSEDTRDYEEESPKKKFVTVVATSKGEKVKCELGENPWGHEEEA